MLNENISATLSDVLAQFCKANNLPFIDAAELVLDEDLTLQQYGWLTAFNKIWDSLDERQIK